MSREDHEIFAGKWKKLNHSNFEAFDSKNPGLSTDKENIELEYILGRDAYESKVYIDGEFQFSSTMKYSGIAENCYGQQGDPDHMKYTIETTQGQSRMPGMSFSYIVKAEDGSLMKQETVSFHGPGRMIVEEAANDVAMITVYEKQT